MAQSTSKIDAILTGCTECGACVKQCAFLQQYGNPRHIAQRAAADPTAAATAFSCSLCGLCSAVCPERLELTGFFLDLRRQELANHPQRLKRYKGLRSYERMGTSTLLSHYSLPDNCDTVLFPGCALAGSRPQLTWQLYEFLKQQQPSLGLVLDCCTKPSHDLGDQSYFEQQFGTLRRFLQQQGIKRVLTACPNCRVVFERYGEGIAVESVYQRLDQLELPARPTTEGLVTIHDPCVSRFNTVDHQAVRSLIDKSGLQQLEMANRRQTTLCCGEGGCVRAEDPALAHSWRNKRAEQADGKWIMSYCAGCVDFLRPVTHSSHVLDLLFDPLTAVDRGTKWPGGLKRYWNRWRLKKQAQQLNTPLSGDRSQMSSPTPKGKKVTQLLLLVALISAIVGLNISGVSQHLHPEQLRDTIAASGIWAPLIFMLIYAAAPALFLPGLPLTILGGILFGPVWGVVYTITGATAGACIAFLIARYLGRDWIRAKLTAPRWQKLDDDVARQGWKVVAFTRLIPLFPFNLLNYAFGLTNIRFSHYAVTSFICMLPATIAFISLSSSLTDLIKGQISKEFIIGVGLIALLSLLPLIWKKIQRKQHETP